MKLRQRTGVLVDHQWWRNLFQSGEVQEHVKNYGIFFSLNDLL